MSNDPAFLFYSSDFLSGIADLNMDERGQYITLLCVQHQKGRLNKKMIGIAVGDAAADVLAKFRHDENGLLYNERLEKEIQKRSEFSNKQREKALGRWAKEKEKEKEKNNTKAYAVALPIIENENENIITILGKYVFKDKFSVDRAIINYSTSLNNLKESFLNFLMSEKYHEKELNDLAMNKMSKHFFRWLSTHQPKKVEHTHADLLEGEWGVDFDLKPTPNDKEEIEELLNDGWVRTNDGMAKRILKKSI
jgi:uncharacterized protein YdaU (DUF1376 family)